MCNDRCVEGRRILRLLIGDLIELTRLLHLDTLLLGERKQLLTRERLDRCAKLARLHRRLAKRLERFALHDWDDSYLGQLIACITLMLLHKDRLQELRQVSDGADVLILSRRPRRLELDEAEARAVKR